MPFSPNTLTLGIDASTQSLSAVLIDAQTGDMLWAHSLVYRSDARLLGLGFSHETLVIPPRETGEAEQPPMLFVTALFALFDDMRAAGLPMEKIAAINTSGQQHGHVYLNANASACFAALFAKDNKEPAPNLLKDAFAYGGAPIWKTANTQQEASEIRAALGGKARMIALSGSDIPLRFSACAHRKIAKRYPEAWQKTTRLMQISSLIPALLAGNANIPLDFGNACGTGLMNYERKNWDDDLVNAASDGLLGGARALMEKLPALAHPLASVGQIAGLFQARYGFAPTCQIIAGSGDNPQSKVLVEGALLSLGTSFVYMMPTDGKTQDESGAANAMYDGLGRPFSFACRTNGALTWDRLRKQYGFALKDYEKSEEALCKVAAGSALSFWHPDEESFPVLPANPQFVRCYQNAAPSFAEDYAALVDSTLGLMYRYGNKIAKSHTKEAISVCGGPSKSPELLRRIAAIWNKPVRAIGAAGAAHGASVAAAMALLQNKEQALAHAHLETLRARLFSETKPVLPDETMVAAFHAKGGYLDQMEAAFVNLKA